MQLDWVEAWFESSVLMRSAFPQFSARRLPHVWHLRNVPGWPELDAFYALADADPRDVIADVRSTTPDASMLLTIFSETAEPVFERYREHGLVHAGGFSQPFMWRELGREEPPAAIGEPFECELSEMLPALEHKISYEGQAVSTAKATLNESGVAYVWGMHTDPEFRCRGHASAGLRAVLDASRMRGMHTAVLCASPLGAPFYAARGFSTAAEMIILRPRDPAAWLANR